MACGAPDLPCFLVLLPDASVRLYPEATLTAGAVLAGYPRHELAGSAALQPKLPRDQPLSQRRTYYLVPPRHTRRHRTPLDFSGASAWCAADLEEQEVQFFDSATPGKQRTGLSSSPGPLPTRKAGGKGRAGDGGGLRETKQGRARKGGAAAPRESAEEQGTGRASGARSKASTRAKSAAARPRSLHRTPSLVQASASELHVAPRDSATWRDVGSSMSKAKDDSAAESGRGVSPELAALLEEMRQRQAQINSAILGVNSGFTGPVTGMDGAQALGSTGAWPLDCEEPDDAAWLESGGEARPRGRANSAKSTSSGARARDGTGLGRDGKGRRQATGDGVQRGEQGGGSKGAGLRGDRGAGEARLRRTRSAMQVCLRDLRGATAEAVGDVFEKLSAHSLVKAGAEGFTERARPKTAGPSVRMQRSRSARDDPLRGTVYRGEQCGGSALGDVLRDVYGAPPLRKAGTGLAAADRGGSGGRAQGGRLLRPLRRRAALPLDGAGPRGAQQLLGLESSACPRGASEPVVEFYDSCSPVPARHSSPLDGSLLWAGEGLLPPATGAPGGRMQGAHPADDLHRGDHWMQGSCTGRGKEAEEPEFMKQPSTGMPRAALFVPGISLRSTAEPVEAMVSKRPWSHRRRGSTMSSPSPPRSGSWIAGWRASTQQDPRPPQQQQQQQDPGWRSQIQFLPGWTSCSPPAVSYSHSPCSAPSPSVPLNGLDSSPIDYFNTSELDSEGGPVQRSATVKEGSYAPSRETAFLRISKSLPRAPVAPALRPSPRRAEVNGKGGDFFEWQRMKEASAKGDPRVQLPRASSRPPLHHRRQGSREREGLSPGKGVPLDEVDWSACGAPGSGWIRKEALEPSLLAPATLGPKDLGSFRGSDFAAIRDRICLNGTAQRWYDHTAFAMQSENGLKPSHISPASSNGSTHIDFNASPGDVKEAWARLAGMSPCDYSAFDCSAHSAVHEVGTNPPDVSMPWEIAPSASGSSGDRGEISTKARTAVVSSLSTDSSSGSSSLEAAPRAELPWITLEQASLKKASLSGDGPKLSSHSAVAT